MRVRNSIRSESLGFFISTADQFPIAEGVNRPDFDNLSVAIVGDIAHSRVAHSTIHALKTLGTTACPPYHIALVIGGTSAVISNRSSVRPFSTVAMASSGCTGSSLDFARNSTSSTCAFCWRAIVATSAAERARARVFVPMLTRFKSIVARCRMCPA